ncbi:MAG: hypothetical protein J7L14_00870 [Candidatus Diapherotrites archaeon]|nr:hypothetical protein [Candidatus Diapherotrites archaeon]
MAKKKTQAKTVSKWKRKQFFEIVAPREFDSKIIGETLANKPEQVIGRTVKVDLNELTKERRATHIILIFKITKVVGNKANTIFIGHELNPSYLGRIIRRRRTKIEVIEFPQTKDRKKVKITLVCVTQGKVSNRVAKAIRKTAKDIIENSARKREFCHFAQEIIFGILSAKIFKAVKKIAPIYRVEVAKSKLISVEEEKTAKKK